MRIVFILTFLLFSSANYALVEKTDVVVVENLIDANMTQGLFDFFGEEVNVIHINSSEFDKYKSNQFIILLGGPDAYDGIGDIVKEVLSSGEEAYLRKDGNYGMYRKSDIWTENQSVFVLAGSDRELTKKSCEKNLDEVYQEIKAGIKPLETPEPATGPTVTVMAGEYGSPFSYWGFEKCGAYTTIRLQSQSGHPITTYTFEELPVRIKLAGSVYEIKAVDNEKLTVVTVL